MSAKLLQELLKTLWCKVFAEKQTEVQFSKRMGTQERQVVYVEYDIIYKTLMCKYMGEEYPILHKDTEPTCQLAHLGQESTGNVI